MKKLLFLLLLLSLSLSLVACPGDTPPPGDTPLVMTSPAEDRFFCESTGVTYYRAPSAYLPLSISSAAYATYTNEMGNVFSFYKVKDADPLDFLCEADSADYYPYFILCAEGKSLPGPSEMTVERILICDAEADYFWRDANVIDTVVNHTNIVNILTAYAMGAVGELPAGRPALRAELVLVSADLPFHYNITYYDFGEEGAYLYESHARRAIAVDRALFEEYDMAWGEGDA